MARTQNATERLRARASAVLAGGVSSDARRLANGTFFVDHGAGAHVIDADGRRFVDYVLGQGPAILGHAAPVIVDAVAAQARRGFSFSAQHEAEVEVAEMVCRLVPCAEKLRFNSVGSEAVHGALRLARAATQRRLILKFEGHYHGWYDPVLYSVHPDVDRAGAAHEPNAVPGTSGQQLSTASDLVIAPWNDVESLARIVYAHAEELAAVILEPILCNTGVIEPHPGFLQEVQRLCQEVGAVLIFDEVITGFRAAPGGAQELLNVTPDLAVFGKAMAGGMQLSALAGRDDLMHLIADGTVAHAGTFNSHPVAIAAAKATLGVLDQQRDAVYGGMERLGLRLAVGLRAAAASCGVPLLVSGRGPMIQTYFTDLPSVDDYRAFVATDRRRAERFHGLLMARCVSIVPRGLWFLSAAHTDDDIDKTLEAAADAFRVL